MAGYARSPIRPPVSYRMKQRDNKKFHFPLFVIAHRARARARDDAHVSNDGVTRGLRASRRLPPPDIAAECIASGSDFLN